MTDGNEPAGRELLFPGDTGELDYNLRVLIVELFRRRYISAEDSPDLWQVLQDNRDRVIGRMHDLLVDLVIDDRNAVAYKSRVTLYDNYKQVSPLRNIKNRAGTTLLMTILRQRLTAEREVVGDQVHVGVDDLIASMENMLTKTSDETRPEKTTRAAITQLCDAKLLTDVGEDRYRISPVLESLMPMNVLTSMLEHFQEANAGAEQ